MCRRARRCTLIMSTRWLSSILGRKQVLDDVLSGESQTLLVNFRLIFIEKATVNLHGQLIPLRRVITIQQVGYTIGSCRIVYFTPHHLSNGFSSQRLICATPYCTVWCSLIIHHFYRPLQTCSFLRVYLDYKKVSSFKEGTMTRTCHCWPRIDFNKAWGIF